MSFGWQTIPAVLLVLFVIVIVHELGHYLFAKWSGIRVDEFAIGFGPRLIGRRIGETLYSIRLVPAGGFVRMAGMMGLEGEADAGERNFYRATIPRRSATILAGGLVEITAIRRGARREAAARAEPRAGSEGDPAAGVGDGTAAGPEPSGRSPLATWALRIQGNLSLVGLALSLLLLWQGAAWALPGLWLLLLGHSFYVLGGVAFRPFRAYGLLYQLGGVAALWPGGAPLPLFALTTAAANLWMSWAVWRADKLDNRAKVLTGGHE